MPRSDPPIWVLDKDIESGRLRPMKILRLFSYGMAGTLMAMVSLSAFKADAAQEQRFFEMRTYYAAPGKLDALNARFRDHTCKLFEKHGIVNLGYWMPVDNTENKLVYLLAFPSREARGQSWKTFTADPDWQAARKASEVNGRLVSKVESVFLKPTDFSPAVKPERAGSARAFELRTYKCPPGRLPNLLARFRDHTGKLFEKHGITNVGYFTPADENKGASDTLIYLLAHKSQEAAAESFKNFRADPAWLRAREDSEKAAGGSLTVPNGVKSEFLTPTDYSPMK